MTLTEERLQFIECRIHELDMLLSVKMTKLGKGGQQYWKDRQEERRLLIEEKNRLTNSVTIQ